MTKQGTERGRRAHARRYNSTVISRQEDLARPRTNAVARGVVERDVLVARENGQVQRGERGRVGTVFGFTRCTPTTITRPSRARVDDGEANPNAFRSRDASARSERVRGWPPHATDDRELRDGLPELPAGQRRYRRGMSLTVAIGERERRCVTGRRRCCCCNSASRPDSRRCERTARTALAAAACRRPAS